MQFKRGKIFVDDEKKIQKAFKLTVKDLIEPWHYDDVIVYADSTGEAKSKGLKEFSDAEVKDYKEYDNRRYVIFTDIQARRIKKYDKILYGGEWKTNEEIEHEEWKLKRDDEALRIFEENPKGIAVVWAGCYNSYWGANRAGHTPSIEHAGKYLTKEAYDIVRGNDYERQEVVILLDVEKYNKDIQDKLDVLAIEYLKNVENLIKAKL